MSETRSEWDKRLVELGWAAWLIGLVGSASLSGLLGQLADLPGKAGVSEIVAFFTAAFGGLALAVGTALAYWWVKTHHLVSWPAVGAVTVSLGLGIVVANFVGIAVVGMDTINAALVGTTAPGPLDTLVGLVAACVLVYGAVASLQAVIAGALLGHWLTLLNGST